MQKQIWDLTPDDLERHPVWYFPTEDDPSCDEATVRPVTDSCGPDLHDAVLVAAIFTDSAGRSHSGYLNWVDPPLLEHAQPVMFVDGRSVAFWFGIARPAGAGLPQVAFPVRVVSVNVADFPVIELTIRGFAYLDADDAVRLVERNKL